MSNQNPAEPAGEPFPTTSLGDMGLDFTTGDNHGYVGNNEPLPAGWYQAMITHTEFKPTKDNTGKRLNLTWEVVDGPHKGRKIFTGLNLVNKNAKAEEIARKELNTICAAMGFAKGHTLRDSNELCGGSPIWISVKVDPGDAQYAAKNEVNGYHPWTNPDPVTGGPIRQKAAAPAPAQVAPGPGRAPTTHPAPQAAAAPASTTTMPPARSQPAPAAQPMDYPKSNGVPW